MSIDKLSQDLMSGKVKLGEKAQLNEGLSNAVRIDGNKAAPNLHITSLQSYPDENLINLEIGCSSGRWHYTTNKIVEEEDLKLVIAAISKGFDQVVSDALNKYLVGEYRVRRK